MLATENSSRKILAIFMGALLFSAGCSPSGPRALMQGDELLRKGHPLEAIKKLDYARGAMPDEPRVWNLLGLAYHRTGQPHLAAQAYQHALAKDKSNLVAVAHYNLGCLFLEQGNAAAAADHLRSFTLTTNSVAGLVKLATAQLRLRRLDLAETTLGSVLRLEPKNVEALNGVGVIHAQKNQRDAFQYFNAALQWDPKYSPAILNAGILAHQNPATRPAALRRYQDYLEAAPQSSYGPQVKVLVQQLEAEFSQKAAASNAVIQAMLKSNALLAALHATNSPATSAPRTIIATNTKPFAVAAKTNVPPLKSNQTTLLQTNALPSAAEPPPVTLVRVTNDPFPKTVAADPVVISRDPAAPPSVLPKSDTTAVTPAEPVPSTPAVLEQEAKRPGLLARLNPFRDKPKAQPETNVPPRLVVLAPQTNAKTPVSKPVFPRYSYLSPAPPASGNRSDAERATSKAIKAERAGNTNEAWLNYHLAIAADPSYFEAQYNAALLALWLGDWKRALAGCETALAIKPESIDTRYNLALALKQANYPQDAAVELERILEAKPNEVRAHLALANLYAQQLDEPQKARTHYGKVLELDPRNPQAAVIRFWLAANP